jgi:acyl-CoA thioesterase-1
LLRCARNDGENARRGTLRSVLIRLPSIAAAFATVLALAFAAPASARTLKLVALGDSLTAGYGVPPGKAFPDQLEAALKAKGWDVTVVDAGVSGDTAADGLARYDWSVPADADALIIELGANDMLRGLNPEATKRTLADILDRARAAHLPTLLAGMRAAPNLGAEYDKTFDAIYPALAQSYGAVLYPFFLDGVAGDAKLNQPDGLHPTAAGVAAIVSRILPSVEALLKRVNR